MMEYTIAEVDEIMEAMGWSSHSSGYNGVRRTVAYALHYGRNRDFQADDPLNVESTWRKNN